VLERIRIHRLAREDFAASAEKSHELRDRGQRIIIWTAVQPESWR